MKKIAYLRKSITSVYLVLLICNVSLWILKNPAVHGLILFGAILGMALETFSYLSSQKRRKLSNQIEAGILVGNAVLVFLSKFQPELLNIAVGIIFTVTLLQIGGQIYNRKIILWEDIRQE
jgi:hypothetical protein